MPSNASVKRILSVIEEDDSKVLGITFNGRTITMKQYLPRAGKLNLMHIRNPHSCESESLTTIFTKAQAAPKIYYAVNDPSATYMIVALDLDAPFPAFNLIGPILHWVQPGLKAGLNKVLTPSEPFVANYIGPAPPPSSSPHRYAFFLFEQPQDFNGKKYAPADGKPLSNWHRMRYDLDVLQKTAKLGEPLAINYFLSN